MFLTALALALYLTWGVVVASIHHAGARAFGSPLSWRELAVLVVCWPVFLGR